MLEAARLFNELRESDLNESKTLVLLAVAAGKNTTTLIMEEFDFLPSSSHYWLKALVEMELLDCYAYSPSPGQYKRINGYSLTKKGEKVVTLLKERLRKIALDATSNS